MFRPLALDLFCKAGGAAMGLYRAGFEVIGVDIEPQPRYPFRFVQADALNPPFDLRLFDFIWASPPCQHYSVASVAARANGKVYPDLVAPTRFVLAMSGVPWCMENVPGAPLRPDLVLDGTMFPSLRVIRRRVFEASFPLRGRRSRIKRGMVAFGGYTTVAGGGVCSASARAAGGSWHSEGHERAAMAIDWMTRTELNNAVPPPIFRIHRAPSAPIFGLRARILKRHRVLRPRHSTAGAR